MSAPPAYDAVLATVNHGRMDVGTVRLLAHRALDEHREQSARSAIEKLPAAVRDDATVQHLLGLLHRACSDLAPALAALDRALARHPVDPRLVHARARVAAEAGLDASDWFARARALAPTDGDVILGQAGDWAITGRLDAATKLLRETLVAHPGWLAGHWALLQMRYAAADPAWLEALDLALAGAPRDPRLHTLKVRALLRAEQTEATRTALDEATRACGTVALAALVAGVMAEVGTLEEAEAAFLALDPLAAADTTLAWLRHLVRAARPERVSALEGSLHGPARTLAWPYFSIAWRLLGDPRAAWLDDPRLVRTVELSLSLGEEVALAEALRALHVAHGQPLDQSVRGGTQTEGPLLSRLDPVIAQLRDRLRAEVASYVAGLPPADPAHPLLGRIPREPRFSGSWSVRLTGGGYHDAHVHSEGWLSSACYVALPGEEETAGALCLGAPQASLEVPLQPLATVRPRVGRLVLFPSTLWHGTRPFSAGERLTVAFDVA